MLRVVAVVALLCSVAVGQEFDGICHLSSEGSQWSGVAISRTEILTVAHPSPTENIWASFPRIAHGANDRVSIKCRVLRANKVADLAVIQYDCPKTWIVKTYDLADERPSVVDIRGYMQMEAVVVNGAYVFPIESRIDGYSLLQLRTVARHGLSGAGAFNAANEVTGIQSGGSKEHTFCADVKTIRQFLGDR